MPVATTEPPSSRDVLAATRPDAAPTAVRRTHTRPAGLSVGTIGLVGAWAVGAVIARLTGASAVVLVLGAALVAFAAEALAGFIAARRIAGVTVTLPAVTTAGDGVACTIELHGARGVGVGRWTIEVAAGRDRVLAGEPTGPTSVSFVGSATFTTPGIVERLVVDVDVVGPAGLVWWRRRFHPRVEPLAVAPRADGVALPIDRSAATNGRLQPRPTAVARGQLHRDGDVDGVRPWRHGDSVRSVHWASSLRADELIVHDREASAAERWELDLSPDDLDAPRVRRTLEHGIDAGHDVWVRTHDGQTRAVATGDDAARWSATVAERRRPGPARRPSILHRPISFSHRESSRLDPFARATAGVASLLAMAMLAGALPVDAAILAVVAVATVAGVVVTTRIARADQPRPVVLRILVALVVVLALAGIVRDAADVDGLLAALRGPLPNLLMLLVVLHGFEVVDRRTLRVHHAISFVVATYAAGLRIDGALGWWLAAWAGALTISLRTSTRPARVDGPRLGNTARRGAAGVAWTLAIAAATVGVLAVVPIPDGPARLGLPALTVDAPLADVPGALVGADGTPRDANTATPERGAVVGYPGFAEALDTSVRGELGDQIVMRVRSPQPAFWRGQTFADFDGRTWHAAPETGRAITGPLIEVPATIGDALGGTIPREDLVQTYFVEHDLPNIVFAAARPVQLIFDGTVWARPDGALRANTTLARGSVYTVVSERVQVDAAVLRAQGDLGSFFAGYRGMAGSEEIEPFLAVPASTTRRTIELADALHTRGASTYDTILAYQAWLAANIEYDLDAAVPPAGHDAVDHFLFESRRGFCEQIASALTIMLRSQGVPARLVTGYVAGERDRVSGVWNVRASDAHAWVEVWFPQTGWQAFDPTADVPLAADAGRGTVGGDVLAAALTALVQHAGTVAAIAVTLAGAGALAVVIARAIARRRRGRWGVLQDRFSSLAGQDITGSGDVVPTNSAIARRLGHGEARVVAEVLDRVAFDPTWVDDDAAFTEAADALASLERECATSGGRRFLADRRDGRAATAV